MEIVVLGSREASRYEPRNPTYAIQIFSGCETSSLRTRLKDDSLYLRVRQHVFDDLDIVMSGGGEVWFSEEQARDILTDFRDYREGVETLMTHCARGKNRSPAVAAALNDIFDLGCDPKSLVTGDEVFPNLHVYKTLGKVAKTLDLDTSRMQATWNIMKEAF